MNSSKYAYPLLFLCAILSFDLSAQWESLDGPYGGHVSDIANNDTYQFAATHDGLFRSVNASNWTKLTFVSGRQHRCSSISVLDSVVVASTYDRVDDVRQFFQSKNNGDTWIEINKPPILVIPRLHLTSFGIYVEDHQELWFSSDEGQTWSVSAYPGLHNEIYTVTVVDDNLWLGARGAIWKSSSSDSNWSSISISGTNAQLHKLFVHDSVILALEPYNTTLFRSMNSGQSWTWEKNEAWGNSVYINFARINDIYFASLDDMILRSDDQGLTWIPAPSRFYKTGLEMLSYHNSLLFAGFKQGVIRSDDFGHTCYSSSHGITAANVTQLALLDGDVLASCSEHGLFNLDQAGQEWTSAYDDTLFNAYVIDFAASDSSLFAIIPQTEDHIYRFSRVHQQWLDVTPNTGNANFASFSVLDDTLFVLGNTGLEQWNPTTMDWQIYSFDYAGETVYPRQLARREEYIFAGSQHQVFRKEVLMDTWQNILQTDSLIGNVYHYIADIEVVNDNIFALIVTHPNGDINAYRILSSTDNGLSWQFAEANFPELNFPWWVGLGPIYNIVGAAVTHGDGYNIGAVVSGIDAVYWESFNEGLPGLFVNDLAVDDTYIYAATSNHGVWRRLVADLKATPVTELSTNETLPIFPNPSNGVFSFTIDLEKPEKAILLFSDINGRIWHSTNWLIANGFNQIELPFAPPGVSFLTLLTKHDKMTAKIIFD